MSYRGCRNWPPVWIPIGGSELKKNDSAVGEIGRLKEARYYATRRGRLFLIIEHEGTEFIGCLIFDDAVFCEKIAKLVHAFLGKPTETIGSSEIYMPRDFIAHGQINL